MAVDVAAHLLPDALFNFIELQLTLANTVAAHLLLPHKPTRIIDIDVSLGTGLSKGFEEVLGPAVVLATSG